MSTTTTIDAAIESAELNGESPGSPATASTTSDPQSTSEDPGCDQTVNVGKRRDMLHVCC
ncbi:Hypothetical predicted protein [Xyrichtys novacula]|uniref:Uncharacterized protein n=1 Tax=Xyrichtys novacula TaxID=13765 RepID=A0AAV1FAP6_XYRNO|nr:Hypothetical predicted protein [Xyrichtys novacula]